MRHHSYFSLKNSNRKRPRRERGVALVTSLLLLLMLVAISLTLVLSVSSDMLINGYYRNYRGSFYASDSGLNVARQAMINGILAAAPQGNINPNAQPIPNGTDANVRANVVGAYGAPTPVNSGGSWPERFQVVNDPAQTFLTLATCNVTGGVTAANGTRPSCANPNPSGNNAANPVTGYTYVYNYQVTTVGESQGSEVTTLSDAGTLTFNAAIVPAGPVQTSFAAWGMFINAYTVCDGSTLVPGTITGPVFTNGGWNFGNSGNYIFTDPVGSVSSTAGYQNGSCQAIGGPSGNGISPTFQAGFNMGAPPVPLPQNDYNQKEAVLDSMGNSGSAVTNAQLNAALRNVSGTPYPAGGAASGVYLPYTVNAQTGQKTFTGGGIYVEGNANVTLSIPAGNSTAQIYTIVQNGVTTTVTIDDGTNTTTIASGNTSTTINGVPTQKDPSTGSVTRDATMLYVDGSITSLSGPGAGQAGIQDNTALTVTAAGNVTVTGDIIYKSEPVTTSQNQIPNTPADTLIPGNDHGQVLGIFTATGDVQLQNSQSSGNLEIDASVATISQNGTGGIVNTGAGINTLNIVGGRIQNNIKNIGASHRNVFFDRRFAQGGFAPPWFPATTVTQNGAAAANFAAPTVSHVQWMNKTSYQ